MGNIILELLKFLLSVIGGILVALVVYELIDVRRKRRIETYWKIEEEYKSEEQEEARVLLHEIEVQIEKEKKKLENKIEDEREIEKKLIEYYNKEYHESTNPKKKRKARKIRHRIRFFNQVGIFVRKKMIDKDLLFNLIGSGFEIDYDTLKFVLNCHREAHEKTPQLYNHFEILWDKYNRWKEKEKEKRDIPERERD